ncbi:hypothetical protein [Haloarcula sp. K1]|uniref:hypothetical protein n=1 Tax=Haloarcula sp. K1 TaxID=1622207 RepID=UPI0007BC2648|nr:hypothetical protein [Haloarcula sp. K1]KZX46224.1 hypothetical protein AV929_15740 [Haloarcula sp. K1]
MSCYCTTSGIDVSFDSQLPISSDDTLLVLFGSRSYTQQEQAVNLADDIIDEIESRKIVFDAIISGGANGADDVAEVVGVKLGVPVIVLNVGRRKHERHSIRADLSEEPYIVETVATYEGDSNDPRSGKGAYLYRNCLMAKVTAQHGGTGLAIWNGQSTGTQHMMDACESHGVPYSVYHFNM